MLTFRKDLVEHQGDLSIVLPFEAASPDAFDGPDVNNLVLKTAASFGFGNAGFAMQPDISPIDAATDQPIEQMGPGVQLKCFRGYFRLNRRL